MLAITGVQLAQSGGDWMTVVLGVLSSALLLVKDGKFLKGLAPVLLVGLVATSCAGLQLPSDVSPSTVENVACNALYQSQCFGDILTSVGINHGTCEADIDALIRGKVAIDTSKIKGLPKVCRDDIAAIQNYIDTAQSAVNKAIE